MRAEILIDLIAINTEHMDDYNPVVTQIEELDVDLKAIIEGIILESKHNREELSAELDQFTSKIAEVDIPHTDIYEAWGFRRTKSENIDRVSMLENCIFNEEAIIKAYQMALATDCLGKSEHVSGNFQSISKL